MRIKAKEDGCEPPSKIGLEKNVLTFLAAQQNLNTLILDPLVDFWRQIKTGSSVIPANQVYLQNYKYIFLI